VVWIFFLDNEKNSSFNSFNQEASVQTSNKSELLRVRPFRFSCSACLSRYSCSASPPHCSCSATRPVRRRQQAPSARRQRKEKRWTLARKLPGLGFCYAYGALMQTAKEAALGYNVGCNCTFQIFQMFLENMLQVFHTDVTKVDYGVAYVAIVVHVYCKNLSPMFHLLQVFYQDVAYVLQWFASVSDTCFKCFICLQTYITTASGCFKSRSGVAHGMRMRSGLCVGARKAGAGRGCWHGCGV
jgi:hypothetical protein